jgi:hypothetical protein
MTPSGRKQIVVSIDPQGKVNIDALNFQGVGCKAATEAVLKYVSGAQTEEHEKPEMYESTAETLTAGCAS